VYVKWFPFDAQACSIDYCSWLDSTDRVNLREANLNFDSYVDSNLWLLYKAVSQPVTFDHDFSCAQIILGLARNYPFYFINFLVPAGFLTIIIAFTFLLPYDSDNRITLAITVLLSFTVYQTSVNQVLPATSQEIPVIVIFYTFIMAMSVISIIVPIVLISISCKKTDIPDTVKTRLEKLGNALRMKAPTEWKDGWKFVASVIDRLCFIIFTVIIVIEFLIHVIYGCAHLTPLHG